MDALDECDESIRHELKVQLRSLRLDEASVMITLTHKGFSPLESLNAIITLKEIFESFITLRFAIVKILVCARIVLTNRNHANTRRTCY